MPNDDNDEGVSMLEVLAEQEALEEDAHAVLGAGDVDNCTYSEVVIM